MRLFSPQLDRDTVVVGLKFDWIAPDGQPLQGRKGIAASVDARNICNFMMQLPLSAMTPAFPQGKAGK